MGNPQDFSFEEQGAASAAPDALSRLNEKLAEAISLKETVDQMEEDLGAAKKQLNHLNTQVIPDMMAELGMEECTQRGWKVKVGEFVSGSLPKEDAARANAIRWLEDHEAGDLLKTNLSVAFTRNQHNEALDLAAQIEQRGFAPNVESTVHPQTLLAFARERLKNGEALDTEVLGLYTGRVAKFKKVGE
jgi:hypothetical protein